MPNQINFVIQQPSLTFVVQKPTLSFVKPTILNFYGGVWGAITGTLTNQTDLQNALNLKENLSNKSDSYTVSSSTTYTSTKGLVDGLSALSVALNSVLNSGLNTKENTITAGTASQYYRGDKSFQTLDKTAVGLANLDNTTDLLKPVSTATLAALNLKVNLASLATVATSGSYTDLNNKPGNASASITGLLASADWINFNNKQNSLGYTAEDIANKQTDLTASATKYPNVNAVNTGLATKEGAITATTSADYYRGDKTFAIFNKLAVGLGNVDNVADVNKPISTPTQTALNLKQNSLGFTPENLANKDQNSGYVGLDSTGKINPGQLPALAISDTFVVASQAEMLALTVQVGDIAVRTDLNKTFILKIAGPTVLANWQELLTPTSAVTSVFGRAGIITAQNADYDTSQVTENGNLYFTYARVLATILSGLSTATNAVITTTDTVLSGFGKLQRQISDNLSTLAGHTSNVSNPHSTTKTQIGLSNVVNIDTTTSINITDSTNKRFVTDSNLATISNQSGINTGDETTATLGVTINGATFAIPNDTDLVSTVDTSVVKKITWSNVKAFLKTYFDVIYTLANLGGTPNTRTISTTSPLAGGGDLSANRTLSISQANNTTSGFLSSSDWNIFNGKQAKTTVTIGFTNSGADYTSDNTTGFDGALSSAISYITTRGNGGLITFVDAYTYYGFKLPIDYIPKIAGLKIRGSKYSRALGSELRYIGVATITNFIDWRGDSYVTAFANLGRDLVFEEITINGNNKVTDLIYTLNTEFLHTLRCRLIGFSSNSINYDYNGVTPVPGTAKPGGDRATDLQNGGAIKIKNATQIWNRGAWFEAGTPPATWLNLISVDKVVVESPEFNYVSTGNGAVTLSDTGINSATGDPTTGVIIANAKFDIGSTQYDIVENRANSASKGLLVTGALISGLHQRITTNPQTNAFLLAGGYNSNSLVQVNEVIVDGLVGTDRNVTFSETGISKYQLYLSASGNLAIRRAGGGADFYWQNGQTNALSLSIFGTAGNGYSFYPAQSSNSTAPSSSGIKLFSDSNGDLAYAKSSDGKRRILAGTLTADRTYTLPDISGTIAFLSNNLSQFSAPISTLNLNSQKIINLLDPTSAQDAATKFYVDSLIQGLDVKASVRLATTANITLSGTQTTDGVSAIVGDRILVKNQTIGSQNGIYIVASGTWSRSTDADTSAKVTSGMYAYVSEGTANGSKAYVLTTLDPIVLDTTSLTFTIFNGIGNTFGTANRAAQFNSSTGNLEASAVTNTELSYLSGVTSPVQTQLNIKASLTGAEVLTNKTLTLPQISTILDTNGNVIVSLTPVASAVNTLGFQSSVAGFAPRFYAIGQDTNIGINLIPKGSGSVFINSVVVPTISSTNTLTNKTLDLTLNTLTGTTAQFNTALSDDDFATLTNTVTLTNKTLTTPILGVASATTINKVTITTPTTGSTLTIANGATLTVSANATVSNTNTGDQTTITGNAGSATTLQTARNINGVAFNGSADIILYDSTKLAKAGDTISGDIGNSGIGYFQLPSGTTIQRPGTPANGMRRYNTDTFRDEFYAAGVWQNHARIAGDTFTGSIYAANLSGTNTGDETVTTIKTKLGITTLSGSNTGDQDLSSFATTLALNSGLATKQNSLGYVPLNPSNNLSDLLSAATARTNLGLIIGTNVQAYSANTTLLGNLVSGSGSIILATSPTFTGTVTLPTGQIINGVALSIAAGTTTFLRGDGTYATPSGSGDVSSNTTLSVDSEVAVFSGITGKIIKRAIGSGYAKLASGVLSGVATIPSTDITGLGTLATQNGTFSGVSSGNNTGDQTITLTGDLAGSGTGSFAATLATVNANVGSFTYANLTVNAKGLITAVSNGTIPEVPLTFGTGLTRSTNTITVNASQNIGTLSNLTTNGFVKTSGATGALSVDTNTYLPTTGGTLTGRLVANPSTTAGSSTNIPVGVAPTSPVEGDRWNDSTQKAQTTFTNGINQKLSGCAFTMTANAAAVANTTTATTVLGAGVGTLTLPANFFVVGKTIKITWYGIFSTTATPTLIFISYLGANNIAGTTAVTLPTVTAVGIKAETIITCRTTGVSGAVRAETVFLASGNIIGVSGAGNTVIDTTASLILDLKAQWGTASASNTVTGINAIVEVLN